MEVDPPDVSTKEGIEITSANSEVENHKDMPEKVDSPTLTVHSQNSVLCDEMLDHLANSNVAFFKSQQVGDPELKFEEKREIAINVLSRSPSQFLARFGQHILESHLDYFMDETMKTEDYEVDFHVNQLRRFHCKAKRQVDVKNRRFEALKKLVNEGTYFSETEMMKRNPLLYDQLIGQYLTRQEIDNRERENRAESQRSYVSYLLQQIEEHETNVLRKKQQDDEDGAVEEVDTSDEDDDGEDDVRKPDGEMDKRIKEEDELCSDDDDDDGFSETEGPHDNGKRLVPKGRQRLTAKEKSILRQEFVTNMYQDFLDGKDADFDYSTIDRNPEFECLAVRTQDEEEKYFDSETPELVSSKQASADEEEEEEDELDKFMKNLKPEATPSELADDMKLL